MHQLKEASRGYCFFKRTMDIACSLMSLIILSPILLIISIAIKLDSKGVIIFGHERIGKDGKLIKVYKFRTMVENSAEVFENFTYEQKKEFFKNFKLKNDPRVTKVGKFLRRASLDELPQLINILKGEMSIVGPRPIVEKEKEKGKYGDCYEKFVSVTPGLTGYWQANGRSDTTYDERVAMDMYYIDNRSLRLDLKIIFQTMESVIKRRGSA